MKPFLNTIAASDTHTIGLKNDGTVLAVGANSYGQCNVGSWRNIVQVASGRSHTVGLKSDGTVVTAGYRGDGQCRVGRWNNIVQIAASDTHTVGLKSDGTVRAVGNNEYYQCEVSAWRDIVQVAAGAVGEPGSSLGLMSNGTVVAAGVEWKEWGQLKNQHILESWGFIVQAVTNGFARIGLKHDGTVVWQGVSEEDVDELSTWKDIIQITVGLTFVAGLKADGSVVTAGDFSLTEEAVSAVHGPSWKDIVQIAGGTDHIVGLKSDGTVLAVGDNDDGRCDVASWKGIATLDTGSLSDMKSKLDKWEEQDIDVSEFRDKYQL